MKNGHGLGFLLGFVISVVILWMMHSQHVWTLLHFKYN
jgi:hypothetical protein